MTSPFRDRLEVVDKMSRDIAKLVKKIDEKINKLYDELVVLQEECPHKNLVGEYHANTGNWSPSDDSYWVEFKCLDCRKRWSENQDVVWYDRDTKTNRTKDGFAFT